jgi:hypothetical protein
MDMAPRGAQAGCSPGRNGRPSVQFHPVLLCNLKSVMTSTTQGIAPANLFAALATTPAPNDVDTAQPQLSACEVSLNDSQIQSATAPTRIRECLCSYERTTGEAARPPPFPSLKTD